jgi:hypothetical protein
MLPFDAAADSDGAVRIHRRCRRGGVTPRGLIDCMIAAVAWRRGATVLAHDADFGRRRPRPCSMAPGSAASIALRRRPPRCRRPP